MRWLLLMLLVGCSNPTPVAEDAAMDAAEDAAVDADLPWVEMGCELSVECPVSGGADAFCDSVHEHIAAAPTGERDGVEDCPEWAWCGGRLECWMCPTWSIRPWVVDAPSPRPDAGVCFD